MKLLLVVLAGALAAGSACASPKAESAAECGIAADMDALTRVDAAGHVLAQAHRLVAVEAVVRTGVALDLLIDAARLAEDIVGHPLPGAVKQGGTLRALREKVRAAA